MQFLGVPSDLREVFVRHHGELLTAAWWRGAQQALVGTRSRTEDPALTLER